MIALRRRYTRPQRAENVRCTNTGRERERGSRLGQDHDCRVRPDVGNVTTITFLRVLDLFRVTTKEVDLSPLFLATPRKSCASVPVHPHLPPCAGAYQWLY